MNLKTPELLKKKKPTKPIQCERSWQGPVAQVQPHGCGLLFQGGSHQDGAPCQVCYAHFTPSLPEAPIKSSVVPNPEPPLEEGVKQKQTKAKDNENTNTKTKTQIPLLLGVGFSGLAVGVNISPYAPRGRLWGGSQGRQQPSSSSSSQPSATLPESTPSFLGALGAGKLLCG